MFTGIIEAVGIVHGVARAGEGLRLGVRAPGYLDSVALGESISVDGVCLTVSRTEPRGAVFDVVPETARRTTLDRLTPGSRVNLERAVGPQGRFGGHFVQGHVDGVGRVVRLQPEGTSVLLTVDAPPEVAQYLVEKGSVAVNGVSLTVAHVGPGHFSVALIPHTQKVTTLGALGPGDLVNLEADIIGKYVAQYVARYVSGREKDAQGLMETLRKEGYVV